MASQFGDAWHECLTELMERAGLDDESVGPFAENAMEWLDCWTCDNPEDEAQVQPRERLGFSLAVKLASYFEEDLCAVFRTFVGSHSRLARQTRDALKKVRAERADLRTSAGLCDNFRDMVMGPLQTPGTRTAPSV